MKGQKQWLTIVRAIRTTKEAEMKNETGRNDDPDREVRLV
jgi:hypothetical protein